MFLIMGFCATKIGCCAIHCFLCTWQSNIMDRDNCWKIEYQWNKNSQSLFDTLHHHNISQNITWNYINLYIRNLKYAQITSIFRLHNIHLVISNSPYLLTLILIYNIFFFFKSDDEIYIFRILFVLYIMAKKIWPHSF